MRAVVTVVAPSLLNLPITNAYKPTYALEGLERLKATAKRSKARFTVENIFFGQYSFERHGLSASSLSFNIND